MVDVDERFTLHTASLVVLRRDLETSLPVLSCFGCHETTVHNFEAVVLRLLVFLGQPPGAMNRAPSSSWVIRYISSNVIGKTCLRDTNVVPTLLLEVWKGWSSSERYCWSSTVYYLGLMSEWLLGLSEELRVSLTWAFESANILSADVIYITLESIPCLRAKSFPMLTSYERHSIPEIHLPFLADLMDELVGQSWSSASVSGWSIVMRIKELEEDMGAPYHEI